MQGAGEYKNFITKKKLSLFNLKKLTSLFNNDNIAMVEDYKPMVSSRNDVKSSILLLRTKKKYSTSLKAINPLLRVGAQSVMRSRNIRSLSTLNNPSQSTAFSKQLLIPSIATQVNSLQSYQGIYKYSFIKKKEKRYEPNADCDSDAHEDEVKEQMFNRLSERYNFIPTPPSKFELKHKVNKDMFRYPKLALIKKRHSLVMMEKIKKRNFNKNNSRDNNKHCLKHLRHIVI